MDYQVPERPYMICGSAVLSMIIRFLRKLKWWLQGRCLRCGVDMVEWSGYISISFCCPLCELKLHKYKDSNLEPYTSMGKKALNEYKKVWRKDYEDK